VERDPRVQADLIAVLFRLSYGTRYLPFVALLAIVSLYWSAVPHWLALTLVVAYTASTASFDWLRHAYRSAAPPPSEALRWGRWFAALSAISGGIWGAIAWIYVQQDLPDERLFLVIALIMLGTTAVIGRSPYLPAYFAFCVPLSVPALAGFMVLGGPGATAAGLSGIALFTGWSIWAWMLHRSQFDAAAVRFQNVELIERLSLAREAAEAGRIAAEAGDRAKSQFLATVSHELRTPLNGILGMTELLLGTGLDAEQRSYVEIARESGEALLTMIDDILDFSRLEVDRLELERLPFDLTAAVEGVVELLAPRARAKGLRMECYIDPALPPRVIGDASRLRQVLINLIGNGIKFTEAGWVVCEVALAGEGRVCVAVSDTGIGIPESAIGRIFERFSQADAAINRKYGGAGLGLAISRRLVQLMGGDIQVRSRPNEGSRFWFTVALPAESEVTPVSAKLPSLAGARVLLVAPAGEPQRLLRQKLVDWGAVASAVDSGRAALSAIVAGQARGPEFDLVVLDESAARGDVAGLLRQLRQAVGRATMPMVLLTDSQVGPEPRLSMTTSLAYRLGKPTRQAALRNVVTAAWHGEPVPATSRPDQGGAEPARRTMRILLVTGLHLQLRADAQRLIDAGHRVDCVGTLLAETLCGGTYDVVLIDLDHAAADGCQRLTDLMQNLAGRPRPCLVGIAAEPGRVNVAGWLAAGLDEVLKNPFVIAELEMLVQRLRSPPEDSSSEWPGGEINPTPLDDLDRLVGQAKTRLMVAEYAADLSRRRERIRAHAATANLAGLRQEGRSLHDTAGVFGLVALARAGGTLARACSQGRLQDVLMLATEIERKIDQGLAALEERYAARKAEA